ncbi:DUF2681 domain-containing protein [Muribacter muris]|uniref:DUF2681 domain-containing protein n=1 Tax=Muribacter muris TaxID=67855 RepID=UPI00069E85C2
MMTLIISVVAGVVILFGVMAYKVRQANQTIEKMFDTQAKLTAQNQQQAVEIQTKKAEIKNAQIKRKNDDEVKRSNAPSVDQRLHDHGWFRAEDNDNGLSGVRADLRQSRGHDRDETSDTGSQSDTSGDL